MRCQPLAHICVLCAAVAFTAPALYAAPDDRLPAPEAASAPGADPQAAEQEVWEKLKAELGITSDAPEPTTRGPARDTRAPQSDADVLPEVHDYYQDLMAKPSTLPPGVTASFEPYPDGPEEAGLPDDEASTGLILNLALRYRGVPYRWGGANRGGLDCSGLIIRAAADGGKPGLPHSAAELWKIGTRVPKAAMRPGDLVFFKNTYKPGISHVGVFAGGTKFVHASSGKGKVTTGDLRDPYFIKHWAGARRWDFLRKKKAPAPTK